ncbi:MULTISPECIES: hypothetical protein [unclassified Pseudonocardia]|uniref:hypothetical protein n=1 Tax=unclassified Pseudonocardia TaxID=2619320 RepID=UPI00095942CF|nr:MULTISPECIES: hypothetical protein [unclassified Pseudonocardia]MBN9099719.1 hypothetical protein [Pseudonocardia sp.]OJY45217.1 MAG: hypothetical protein BGP03_15575 [Pseudonocardia sp. 73-21]
MRKGFGRPKAVADTIAVVPGGPGDPGRKADVRKYFRLALHPNNEIHLLETGIGFVIDVLRRLQRERKAIGPRP